MNGIRNIVDRLNNDEFTNDELLMNLDSSNPVILYAVIACIVRNHITDKKITDKLIQLSELLSDEYKMLGYYKLGHVSMGALLTLGIDEKIVFKKEIDRFDKETAKQFMQNAW